MQRFTISLDEHLAGDFDRLIAELGYANRSEAVSDLLRAELERSRQHAPQGQQCVARLSCVYNHHQRELGERLTTLHQAHHHLTLATMHADPDHEHGLETVLLRGPAAQVRGLADAVGAERGVPHGQVNLISVETYHHHCHGGEAEPHVHLRSAN